MQEPTHDPQPDDGGAAPTNGPPLEDRTRHFFEAAEPLLTRYGMRKTTVEEICHAAGASKRTFYELFRDKQDLVVQMLAWLVRSALGERAAAADPAIPSADKLESLIIGYERFAREHPVFQECFHEEATQDLQLGRQIHEQLQCVRDAMEDLIAEGIARGEFRQVDTGAMVLILDGLLDAMYYVYPKLIGTKSALDDPVLARELRYFIINGLRDPVALRSGDQR